MIRNAWIWCQGGVFWLSDTNNHLPIIQRTSGCVLCSFPCKQSLRYVTYDGKLSWAFINKTITYSSLDFKMLERSIWVATLEKDGAKFEISLTPLMSSFCSKRLLLHKRKISKFLLTDCVILKNIFGNICRTFHFDVWWYVISPFGPLNGQMIPNSTLFPDYLLYLIFIKHVVLFCLYILDNLLLYSVLII